MSSIIPETGGTPEVPSQEKGAPTRKLTGFSVFLMRWSWFVGQIGGVVKVYSGV
jgi:hypothetical protein